MNLYEFRPDPNSLPKPVPAARTTWVSNGILSTEFSGYWQTAATDVAPGMHDILLAIHDHNGTQVMPGPNTFQFVLPDGVGPGGQINTRLSLPAEIVLGGYRLSIVVDNRKCTAAIDPPKIGTRVADPCGILRYTPAVATPVTIAFKTDHPAGYGVFSFSIVRGATAVPTTDVSASEISASSAGVYVKNPSGVFVHDFPISALLGPCTEAAFSENLYAYAKATTGNGYRIGDYDASSVWAFALFKSP
jgi:hypothetical protein